MSDEKKNIPGEPGRELHETVPAETPAILQRDLALDRRGTTPATPGPFAPRPELANTVISAAPEAPLTAPAPVPATSPFAKTVASATNPVLAKMQQAEREYAERLAAEQRLAARNTAERQATERLVADRARPPVTTSSMPASPMQALRQSLASRPIAPSEMVTDPVTAARVAAALSAQRPSSAAKTDPLQAPDVAAAMARAQPVTAPIPGVSADATHVIRAPVSENTAVMRSPEAAQAGSSRVITEPSGVAGAPPPIFKSSLAIPPPAPIKASGPLPRAPMLDTTPGTPARALGLSSRSLDAPGTVPSMPNPLGGQPIEAAPTTVARPAPPTPIELAPTSISRFPPSPIDTAPTSISHPAPMAPQRAAAPPPAAAARVAPPAQAAPSVPARVAPPAPASSLPNATRAAPPAPGAQASGAAPGAARIPPAAHAAQAPSSLPAPARVAPPSSAAQSAPAPAPARVASPAAVPPGVTARIPPPGPGGLPGIAPRTAATVAPTPISTAEQYPVEARPAAPPRAPPGVPMPLTAARTQVAPMPVAPEASLPQVTSQKPAPIRGPGVQVTPTPASPVSAREFSEPQSAPAPTPPVAHVPAPPPAFVPAPVTVPNRKQVSFADLPPAMEAPRKLGPEFATTQPGIPGPYSKPKLPAPAPVTADDDATGERAPHLASSTIEQEALVADEAAAQASEAVDSDQVLASVAPAWRRSFSWLLDFVVIAGLVGGALFLAMSVLGKNPPASLHGTAATLFKLKTAVIPGAAAGVLLVFLYTTLFAFLLQGRTLGRLLLGIRLVDSSGKAPGAIRATFRSLFALLSFALFLSGFWLALFDRRGQTLHDKLTRTFVVRPV